ncbi:MAG: SDR family NAD(P)-dependent oxidoreductase [Streptosporangiaceae bacterium]
MLTGRRAVVTGGARGMGRAHGLALSAAGASVVLVDIDADELTATADELRSTGADVSAVAGDITARGTAEAIIDQAAVVLGGLDILVHNAGLMYSMTGLADTDDDDFRRLFAVNVDAPLFLTRASLPLLRASKHGRVIFISSQWGQVPDGHSYGYMASKAAQLGLMKAMAKELAVDQILVNAIAPGAVMTRMVPEHYYEAERSVIPLGRLAEPGEIAAVVAFLASDAASFLTGQTVAVNGGACIVGI